MPEQTRERVLAPALISAAIIVIVLASVRGGHSVRTSLGHETLGKFPSDLLPPRSSNRSMAPLRTLTGTDRLDSQLGPKAPTGAGVIIGHVEGVPGDYMPRTNENGFREVEFIARSGPSKINGHAQATARIIYGADGLAPGVRQVHHFTVADFIGKGYLHAASASPEPRLFNHSWVGRRRTGSGGILRRVDHIIDTRDVVMVVGVDNGRSSPVPGILSSAYNVIAVGAWDGDSSGGYTRTETAGRCKPDIVAPGGRTSFSTAVVTAVVARLLETADRISGATSSGRAEVIKAVLLAGASKPGNWKQPPGRPLDPHFGAGRVDLDRSHAILTAGRTGRDGMAHGNGWNVDHLERGKSHIYSFDLGRESKNFSVILVWHRRATSPTITTGRTRSPRWSAGAGLADFDLSLVGPGENDGEHLLARSASRIDNVEHLYLTSPTPGLHQLEVRRNDDLDDSWEYAIAWHIDRTVPTTRRPPLAGHRENGT